MSKPVMEDLIAFSGRRNRKSFFMHVLIQIGLGVVFVGLAFLSTFTLWIAVIATLPVLFVFLVVLGQRCRDFGWTGWAALAMFLPYIGVFVPLVALFVPGTIGENRYGADPLQDSVNR